MTGVRDIWRQRLGVWLPATLFVAANLAALAVYHFAYSNRVNVLRQELEAQGAAEKAAHAEHLRLEGLLQRTQINRQRVAQLYDEHFSTRKRRMTAVTAEVEALAARAGLAPRAFTYPEEEIQRYGLIKRSFIFTVQGTYPALRRFINLLELSDSFLTLEGVSLAEGAAALRGAAPQELRVDLRLSTLFAKEGGIELAAGPRTRAQAPAAPAEKRP